MVVVVKGRKGEGGRERLDPLEDYIRSLDRPRGEMPRTLAKEGAPRMRGMRSCGQGRMPRKTRSACGPTEAAPFRYGRPSQCHARNSWMRRERGGGGHTATGSAERGRKDEQGVEGAGGERAIKQASEARAEPRAGVTSVGWDETQSQGAKSQAAEDHSVLATTANAKPAVGFFVF